MNLVSQTFTSKVDMRITTKRPVGDLVATGDAGVVKSVAFAGRVVYVEFDKQPGNIHRMERIDVEEIVETTPVATPASNPSITSADHNDHDEL